MIFRKFLFILFMLISFRGISQYTKELLIARNSTTYKMWDGNDLKVFGFAKGIVDTPLVPSRTLYFEEGDSVKIDLWNFSQGAPHTIHLHGLDVDQANDGVGHLSFEVEHFEHGFYYFKAPHPGTYLYHCHVLSTIHVQAGMYGLIIVKPKKSKLTWEGGYAYTREWSWLMSEMDSDWHVDSILHQKHDTTMKNSVVIPQYSPEYFLINGKSEHELNDSSIAIYSDINDTVLIRLANIGFYANSVIFPKTTNPLLIASDGRPLPKTEPVDTVWIFPGERYEVLITTGNQLYDGIKIDFVNLNTLHVESSQFVPIKTSTVYSSTKNILKPPPFSIYPNPSKGIFSIKTLKNDFTPFKYSLFSTDGKLIFKSEEIKNKSFEIDLSDKPNGNYLLKIGNTSQVLIKHD